MCTELTCGIKVEAAQYEIDKRTRREVEDKTEAQRRQEKARKLTERPSRKAVPANPNDAQEPPVPNISAPVAVSDTASITTVYTTDTCNVLSGDSSKANLSSRTLSSAQSASTER
jgi:hypothetical protein